MKKLVAYLQGKLEEKKVENKVKRVEAALNIADLNFKTQKDDNECKLDGLLEEFNNTDACVEDTIKKISDTMDLIAEAEEGRKKVEKIKNYLFEEIKG